MSDTPSQHPWLQLGKGDPIPGTHPDKGDDEPIVIHNATMEIVGEGKDAAIKITKFPDVTLEEFSSLIKENAPAFEQDTLTLMGQWDTQYAHTQARTELLNTVASYVQQAVNSYNGLTSDADREKAITLMGETCPFFGQLVAGYIAGEMDDVSAAVEDEDGNFVFKEAATHENAVVKEETNDAPAPQEEGQQMAPCACEDTGGPDEEAATGPIIHAPQRHMTINGNPVTHITRHPEGEYAIYCQVRSQEDDEIQEILIPDVFNDIVVHMFMDMDLLTHVSKESSYGVTPPRDVYVMRRRADKGDTKIEVSCLTNDDIVDRDNNIYFALESLYDLFTMEIGGQRALRTGVTGQYAVEEEGKLKYVHLADSPHIVYRAHDNGPGFADDATPTSLRSATFVASIEEEGGEKGERAYIVFTSTRH